MKSRWIILVFWGILLVALGVIFNRTVDTELEEVNLEILSSGKTPSIPVEEGVFKGSYLAKRFSKMNIEGNTAGRSMDDYYSRRAFPGAPPVIPHPLVSEQGIGGKDCLQCHQSGGYVNKFSAYAPVTPHPEMINCKQCHVPQASGSFVGSNWEKVSPPETYSALVGSPPVIPHDLQMRENCLACHAGPAAPKEIRVSHPERINCRQCHAASNPLSLTSGWVRQELTTAEE